MTAIFYSNEHQRQLAEQYICELQDSFNADKAIATKILPASTFYEAEAYHQDFYKKNPERYKQEQQDRANYIKNNHM